MPYITAKHLAKLKKIAATATMDKSSFGFNCQEKFKAPLDIFGLTVETTPDEFIKARTRIWRQSNIVEPLQDIIEDIENRQEARK